MTTRAKSAALPLHRSRAERIADLAVKRDLDGVLVWSRGGGAVDQIAGVWWLTGFSNPWPAVPDSPLWRGQAHSAALVDRNGRITLITNIPASEWQGGAVICDDWVDEPFLDVGAAQVITRSLGSTARVGIAGCDVLPMSLWEGLRRAAPNAEFVSVDEPVQRLRRCAAPEEYQTIRDCGIIADQAMTALINEARPGLHAGEGPAAMYAAVARAGGAPYGLALAAGPAETRFCPATIPSWPDRILAEGDIWRVDLWGCVEGYFFDFARTTVVGAPTPDQTALIDQAIAVVDAAATALEPGRRIGDAAERGLAALTADEDGAAVGKHDYPHVGHTLGIGWGDVWLTANNEDLFEAGMVVAVETFISREGIGGAMVEQNYLITDSACELLTKTPLRPWVATP